MSASLNRAAYLDLLSMARRHARGRIEAEDLLHEALIAAFAVGRGDARDGRAWLAGTMRNIALMNARGAMRRRRREERFCNEAGGDEDANPLMPDLDGLSPSLRIVALLALSGHSRAEIRHLLRLSDEALRQRIAAIRRTLRQRGEAAPREFSTLRGSLNFGLIRRSMLPLVRAGIADFASHDPDGHPIAFAFSDRGLTKHKSAATRRNKHV